MNIIEKLGVEKCRAIVEGAPSIAEFYVLVFTECASAYYFMDRGVVSCCTDNGVKEIANKYESFEAMTLSWEGLHGVHANDIACGHINDIRQAITQYERNWGARTLKKGDHAVWLKSHSRSSEVFKIDTDKSGKMGMRPASKKEIEQGFRDEN